LEKTGLNKALKDKLKNLVDAEYQNLTFNVHITNKDGSLEIISRKEQMDDPEIVVYEVVNGKKKPITSDTFHLKYNLIYDIPNNPSERLEQLVKEIEVMQGHELIKIQGFRQYLKGIIEEIKHGKDPKKIEELSRNISELNTKNNQVINDFKNRSEVLNKIEKYSYCKRYNECMMRLVGLEIEKKELEKTKKENKQSIKKKNKEYEEAKKAAIELVIQLNEKKLDVYNQMKGFIPKDKKNLLEVWQGLNFTQYLTDLDAPPTFTRVRLEFERIMEKEKKNRIPNTNDMTKAKVLTDLIDFLEHYRETNVILPGVDKTVNEFIEILKLNNQAHQNAVNFANTYNCIKNNLEDMKENFQNFEKKIGEIYRLRDKIPIEDVDSPDIDDLMDKITQEETRVNHKAESIEMELHKRDVSLDSIEVIIDEFEEDTTFTIYISYDEEQLNEVISSIRREVNNLKATKDSNERTLSLWKSELHRLDSVDEHPYQKNKDDLEELLTKVMKIESRMDEFSRYIRNIESKKFIEKLSDKEKRYNEAVFSYLGRKVGYIRHIETEYKVTKIDMLDRIIYTDTNEKIRLDDMSTGQGQMAYLMGLLNPNDNRKIIALFDEVAMMSSKSLNPIYERFRTLYDADRLLIGIVVQKGEEVQVISKLGESAC
jgi:exonuclease SbcC